jgi:hypothetical protein
MQSSAVRPIALARKSIAGWNTPARNAAINKRPCNQKTLKVFGPYAALRTLEVPSTVA